MSSSTDDSSGESAWVEHIPVRWFQPHEGQKPHRLIIFLPHFSGTKEQTTAFLRDLAVDGFLASSFPFIASGRMLFPREERQHGRPDSGIHPHLPALRPSKEGMDANRCLPVFLRVRILPCAAKT